MNSVFKKRLVFWYEPDGGEKRSKNSEVNVKACMNRRKFSKIRKDISDEYRYICITVLEMQGMK